MMNNVHHLGQTPGTTVLFGRANVGKTSLIHALCGQSLFAVSAKRHTTRQPTQLVLKPDSSGPILLLDTPGVPDAQAQEESGTPLGALRRGAYQALEGAERILWVTEGTIWTEQETQMAIKFLGSGLRPRIWILNKVDKVCPKERLLLHIDTVVRRFPDLFQAVFPISAKTGSGLPALKAELGLPDAPEALQVQLPQCANPWELRVQEAIRERLYRCCHQELPYSVQIAVERLEGFKDTKKIGLAVATLHVQKESHKRLLLGSEGHRLMRIQLGSERRLAQQRKAPVQLKLRVAVLKTRRPLSTSGWPSTFDRSDPIEGA